MAYSCWIGQKKKKITLYYATHKYSYKQCKQSHTLEQEQNVLRKKKTGNHIMEGI